MIPIVYNQKSKISSGYRYRDFATAGHSTRKRSVGLRTAMSLKLPSPKNLHEEDLQLLVCTWNVGNKQPLASELAVWLPENGGKYDVVVIGTQENMYRTMRQPTTRPKRATEGQQQQSSTRLDEYVSDSDEELESMRQEAAHGELSSSVVSPRGQSALRQKTVHERRTWTRASSSPKELRMRQISSESMLYKPRGPVKH